MKLVVDIPNKQYELIKQSDYNVFSMMSSKECMMHAIKFGTPLPDDVGDFSDGYHTFNQLYHQRAVLFATIVNLNSDISWKSWKHEDGKYCVDSNGEWFIVGVDTPEGSYTYHYSKEYWDLFKCQELEYGKPWDGHTEKDVDRLLSLDRASYIVGIIDYLLDKNKDCSDE